MYSDIRAMSDEQRRELLASFVEQVLIPQRSRLLAYREHTHQSAQVDSDGYLGQVIAAIVTGELGNIRRGKSGKHPGDLADGTEVKSAYRLDQMNGKLDSHVNFGQVRSKKLRELFNRERIVIVHYSLDLLGRMKIEVLALSPKSHSAAAALDAFLKRSKSEKPQLQPRLYPDGRHDRLQELPGHFLDMGARLMARAVIDGSSCVVDKWAPDAPLPLAECLDSAPATHSAAPAHTIHDPTDADEFFDECMLRHFRALSPYCEASAANKNIGYANVVQHLVSVVTGIRGSGSGARGPDLEGNGEIKLAAGIPGDDFGTEDWPRLNFGASLPKLLGWKTLFPVRLTASDGELSVQVFQAPISAFRSQVRKYFDKDSEFAKSKNIQYHPPKSATLSKPYIFTGKNGFGGRRQLVVDLIYSRKERI